MLTIDNVTALAPDFPSHENAHSQCSDLSVKLKLNLGSSFESRCFDKIVQEKVKRW